MNGLKVAQVLSSVLLLPSMLSLDSGHCLLVVFVQDTPNMGGYLANKSSVCLEVEANNIKLSQAFNAATGRSDVIVDNITFFSELEMCTDQEFSDVC